MTFFVLIDPPNKKGPVQNMPALKIKGATSL